MSFQNGPAPRMRREPASPVDLVWDARAWFFRWVIDASRQVPSPSAAAWLVTLEDVGAPRFVVLRQAEDEAVEALADFLIDLGAAASSGKAHEMLASAGVEHVGVVW